MFRQKPPVSQPPNEPEQSGFRCEIRLTEEALLKLLPWITGLVIGGGIAGAGWQVSQTKTSIPTPAFTPAEVEQPQR